MNPRRRVVALAVALPLVLAAGCTVRIDGRASAGTTASATSAAPRTKTTDKNPPTTEAPAPTDERLPDSSQFPADTSEDSGPAEPGSAAGGGMHVAGIRLATHDGFDRLVIDLTGGGVPEWAVRYTEASGPGGGPVDIAGDAFLRVSLATGSDGSGQGSSSVTASPGTIAGVVTTGSFEGVEEVLVGIHGGQAPFRAFALTDPGRIVLDVRPAG